MLQRYAWSDDRLEHGGLCAKRVCHFFHGLGYDAFDRPPPSGMYGTYGVVLHIIEQHGYAIGSGDTDADTRSGSLFETDDP